MANIDVKSGVTSTGLNLTGTTLNVSSGGKIIQTTLNTGAIANLFIGAAADTTQVNSGAQFRVYSSAVAQGVNAGAGATFVVYAGGTATGVSLNSAAAGHFTIGSGTLVSGSYAGGGNFSVSGGTASGLLIGDGCSLTAYTAGLSAVNIVQSGDGKLNFNVAKGQATYIQGTHQSGSFLLSGGVASGFLLNADTVQNVSGGGITSDTILYGDQYLSGGTAIDTELYGNQLAAAAGKALNTKVHSGGAIIVVSGAVSGAVLDKGGALLIANGSAENLNISSGGILQIEIGNSNTVVNGTISGQEFSLANNVASGFILYAGACLDVVQGTVLDTSVSSGGYVNLSGGRIQNVTAFKNGSVTLYGGTAQATILSSGGRMNLSGGYASGTIISKGGVQGVSSGGVAVDTIAYNSQFVYSGGSASNTVLLSGGRLSCGASADVEDVTVSSGAKLFVQGEVSDIDVFAGGSVYVSAAGTLQGSNTFYGGSLILSGAIYDKSGVLTKSGAMLSGSLQINDGTVSAMSGAIIDFTVAEQENASVALINNWSLISGGADALYTLTVEADQEEGLYVLAGGASGFSNSVTVKTTENAVLGTLSAGQTKTFGNTDYTLSLTGGNLALTISGEEPVTKSAKSDVDGNNISDIVFQWTGNNYQIGYWMNGTNDWQSQGGSQPQDWELIGAYDMDQNGKADIVMRGNIQIGSDKGAYIGYYVDGDVTNWKNISYLNNPNDIDWRLAIGNITGNEGCNSLVWYSPELGALGVWTDGTDNWVSLGNGYDYSWTLEGCGDFNGDGKDDILFSRDGNLYCTDIDNNFRSLGGWSSEWKVCTTGDFSGDGTDDIIVQKGNMVVKFEDGLAENWVSLGALDAEDWFIVGAGDYNGDQKEDLLVRQYSTGMLGYYSGGDMDKWVEVGRGVDMNWTVIA